MGQRSSSTGVQKLYSSDGDLGKQKSRGVCNKTFLIFFFVFSLGGTPSVRAAGSGWVESGTEAGGPCLTCDDSTAQTVSQTLARIPVLKWPVSDESCRITSLYKEKRGRKTHLGLDFDCEEGDPIYPVGPGQVIEVNYRDDWGWYIRMRLVDGKVVTYAHLKEQIPVEVGQVITTEPPAGDPSPGQILFSDFNPAPSSGEKTTLTPIGRCGDTGRSTGAHLHIDLYPSDQASSKERQDPLPYLTSFLGEKTCSVEPIIKKRQTSKGKKARKGK